MYTSQIKSMLLERANVMSQLINDKILFNNICRATAIITNTIEQGGKIMCIGNGGSAAQAQHLCAELMGRMKKTRSPFKALFLGGDISTITCIANDFGYERIYSRQLEALSNSNDCVIAFTTSGKSRNILEALSVCYNTGVESVVLSGGNINELERVASCVIPINADDTCILQEVEMVLIHIISSLIEEQTKNLTTFSVWGNIINYSKQGYKYLLLDRDGIINKIKANGYITQWDEFVFVDSFLENINVLTNAFKYIFIVTNQKGVSKGLLSEANLNDIHSRMIKEIQAKGGNITNIYISTGDDINRKPNIGMANQIMNDYPDVDFNKAIMVGDSMSDMLFAQNIGAKYVYARTN